MKKKSLMILAVMFMLVGCSNTNTPDTEANTQQTESQSTSETETLEADTEEETTEVESTTEVSTEAESEATSEVETETQEESEAPSEEPQAPIYTYTNMDKTMYAKSSVNVRSLPSTDGEKLGGLSKTQEVHVTGQCNETGWYRIDYNGGVAYVSNSYLVNDKPVEETPAPEEPTQPSEPESGDPLNVEGLPFVPFQVYDEGDVVYYWYPEGAYDGYGTFTEQKNTAYAEAERIIYEKGAGTWNGNSAADYYYYECSWGNTVNANGRYVSYAKYAWQKVN